MPFAADLSHGGDYRARFSNELDSSRLAASPILNLLVRHDVDLIMEDMTITIFKICRTRHFFLVPPDRRPICARPQIHMKAMYWTVLRTRHRTRFASRGLGLY